MNSEKQWEAKAKALADQHGVFDTGELPGIRKALIELDDLLRTAPASVQQSYKAIDEARLRDLTSEAEDSLDKGSQRWLDRPLVEAAAAQARALDQYLFQHREPRGKPDDPNRDYLCVELDKHAIPRPSAAPPADPKKIVTTTYRRRGLVWHRLLPRTTAGGFEITLEWHRDLSLFVRKAGIKVMSALFQDLTLVPNTAFANFVASDAPCADEDATIAAQAAAVYGAGVALAVWPELTMPKARRDKLAAALLAQSKTPSLGSGPSFVAAGSWHEVDGKAVHNRMHILSRSGRPKFFHDKSIPLVSKSLGKEQLTPSYRIPVLILEDVLVAFAICRDFCEAQISKVYGELDVDLVVVPSYGDKKTIEAHQHQALNLSNDPGTRSFVVQQVIPDEIAASGIGYVLPPECDWVPRRPLRSSRMHSTKRILYRSRKFKSGHVTERS